MNHDQFAYWLQGFVEMNGGKEPTKAQWKMIKDHLQLCFWKTTLLPMPYAKGVGTGGAGTGVLGAGVVHHTPNGYVHVVGGDGSYASGAAGSLFENAVGGAGAPFENGRYLTNEEIAQRKAKGGGGGLSSEADKYAQYAVGGAGVPMNEHGRALTNAEIALMQGKGGDGG